jgi:uncharacterized membrane protein (UPF0127 family)
MLMKRVLLTIGTVILLIASILVFWAGLAPNSFSEFFSVYPKITTTASQMGLLKTYVGELSNSTSSEPVLGVAGRLKIGGNSWEVEIAGTEASRTNGLSNRKALYNKGGMLFVFDRMANQAFWMKDMLIPIDMVFFDNNWRIVLIEANLQPQTFPKIFGSQVKSQYVLEINAGEADFYGLQVGDQAIFTNR